MDIKSHDKVDRSESRGNKPNLSNLSASKKSNGAGYLTSNGAKKGSGKPNSNNNSTKKGVKVARGSNYLTPSIKKAFQLLQHTFK